MSNTSTNFIQTALKGLAMGIAEVIPGVSGGTIAFITGIYERLLHSIKTILGPGIFKAYRNGGVKEAWRQIDGTFLLSLLIGMLTGIIIGVFGVSHLLLNFPQLVWSFFFGLILASAVLLFKQVGQWNIKTLAALILTTIAALYYTLASPAEGTQELWFVFISGSVAISALMLPGVSGSFILVLLGMYAFVLGSVKQFLTEFDLASGLVVVVFAIGCLIGLATFSRVLTWTFKHYYQITMAALTGFLIGSLNKIWPWKAVVSWRTDSHGEQVALLEKSVLPAQYDGNPMLIGCITLTIVGFLAVILIEKMGKQTTITHPKG
jgi:putative membrane protein